MVQATRRAQSKPAATALSAIPDRLYYRIGEVARYCAVAPSVLRFWETQFPQLKPVKGGTGQRLYRRRELELALRIQQLVHVQGYTLAGARQAILSPENSTPPPAGPAKTEAPIIAPASPAIASPEALVALRKGLTELRSLLIRQGTSGSASAPVRNAEVQQRRRSRATAFAPSLFSDLQS